MDSPWFWGQDSLLFSLFLPFSAASLSSQNSACPSLDRIFESLLVLAIFASFPRLIPNDRGTRFHRKFPDSSVFTGKRIDGKVQMEILERTFDEKTSGSAILAKTKGETQVAGARRRILVGKFSKIRDTFELAGTLRRKKERTGRKSPGREGARARESKRK